jgi:hypothetical protein
VKVLIRWGMGVSAAAVALAMFAGAAPAQQQVAPVAKAAVTPVAAQTEPKKIARRAASKCRGLDEMACGATAQCTWVAASKTKTGRELRAHCRAKPKTTGRPAAPAAVKPGEPMPMKK